MGLVAEFEAACEQLPLVAVAAAVPDAALSVEMRPNEAGHTLFLVDATHDDHGEIEAALSSTAFVAEHSLVRARDGTRRYRVLPAVGIDEHYDEGFDVDGLKALARTDCRIDETRVTPTGWVQSGWFADRAVLERFRSFWRDHGGFTLLRLTRDAAEAPPGDGLTDRQRAALLTAHGMGYFDVPRGASLEDVAAELDISTSSCSERLRRAQSHLVETALTPVRPPASERDDRADGI